MRSFEEMLSDIEKQQSPQVRPPSEPRKEPTPQRSRGQEPMTTSKYRFSQGVSTSYQFVGWVILAISALMGIPMFYVALRKLTDSMFALFQLPGLLTLFLSKLVWGLSILLCVFLIVKIWQSALPLLTKLGAIAFAAFIGFTMISMGDRSTFELLVTLGVALAAAFSWWKVQVLQLAPFIIYRNKRAAEVVASEVDNESQRKGTQKAQTKADQIRSLGLAHDSATQQLATACLFAFGAYVVEAAIGLFTWIQDPISTVYHLFTSLFNGTFWQTVAPILTALLWVFVTCALTEIGALQLIGTDRIPRWLKVGGAANGS